MSKIFLFEDYYDVDQLPSENSEFSIPLGISEDNRLEEYHISGENGGPILVSGRCGSGKSNYLHTILNATILRNTSEQVNIWLYEYEKLEFRDFLNGSVPHITSNWIGSEHNSKEAFVAALEEEIKTRQKVFMDMGCNNFDHYLRDSGNPYLPRLLVVIEDFHTLINELFEADYSYKYRLDNILRMAHAFGITLVFAVQDVYHCQYLTANILSKHIAMIQTDDSIKEQFNCPDVVELAQSLFTGEAIIDIPSVHKVNLLYIRPDVERKVIAKYRTK